VTRTLAPHGAREPLAPRASAKRNLDVVSLCAVMPGDGASSLREHHRPRKTVPSAPDLVAGIRLTPTDVDDGDLYEAISTRRTNRNEYGDFALDPRIVERLQDDVAGFPGVTLRLLTSDADKGRFASATVAATKAFIADDEMLRDSDQWFRHTEEQIDAHRDGPTLDAQIRSNTIAAFAKGGQQVSAERSGSIWLSSTERIHTGPCSAYAVISTPTFVDQPAAVAAGRAYQRLTLRLEALGLAAQPLSQLAEMRDREVQLEAEPEFGRRLDELTAEGEFAQQLFRLGYARHEADKSPRRPLSWVVMGEEA